MGRKQAEGSLSVGGVMSLTDGFSPRQQKTRKNQLSLHRSLQASPASPFTTIFDRDKIFVEPCFRDVYKGCQLFPMLHYQAAGLRSSTALLHHGGKRNKYKAWGKT